MKHLDAGRLAKLTLAAAVAWALPQASLAQSQQLSQALPRQPLADALDSLAKISGLQFVYSADLAAGITSQGAAAGRSVEEALREILRDTGLTYEFINERTVTIARSGLAPQSRNVDELLETVNVFGTLDTPLTVGSKTGQSLRETPKSVTIVTRERIEAQNLTTVTEAMQQATGITVRPYDPVQSWYYARGYRVDVTQLDGGAPITAGFGNFSSPDSAMFERIEVLRGVDGMFSGAGDPGGVINLVRKRALRSPALNVTASAGSWSNYRLELDATGSLARDGQMRGRAVGVFEDKEYFWDRADSNKKMVYGVLENDIGSDIVVSVGGVYENRRDNGYWYGGVPRYADGRDLHLSRTRSLVPDWGFSETTTKEVFAKLDYDIRDNLALAMNVTYQDQQSESLTAYVKGAINPVTLTGASFTSWANDTPSERAAVDLHLKGSFELFGREHKFAVGGDYSKSDGGGARFFYMMGYPFVNGPTVDVFNFNPSLLPRPNRVLNPAAFTNRISPVYGQVQYGGYATLGLQLADPLRLTIGGRYTNYEQEEQSYRLLADGTRGPTTSFFAPIYSEHALIPSAALTYEISPRWNAYASYAQTFKPQTGLLKAPEPGVPLDPITGDGYEVGVKGEVFDGLNTSIAVYSVKRIGEGLEDPAYGINYGAGGSSCCYIDNGDITMQGVDFELSGVVTRDWQLFAGYTYARQKLGSTSGDTDAAMSFNFSPKHLFKMWTTWRLPGALSDWTFNAGVVTQSEILVLGSATVFNSSGVATGFVPFRYTQGGYSLWNASVQYRLSERWSAALYADNIFDKTYYAALNSSTGGNIYGEPRNLTLRLQAKF